MPDRSYEIAVRGADWGQAARAMRDFAAATKSVSTMQGPDLAVRAEKAATAWGKFATAQASASAKVTAQWVSDANKRAMSDEAAANKRAKVAVDATRQELRDNDALGRAMQGRQGPSFGSRLSTAVRSTRFGMGGVSPLVGRSLDVLGMGEAAAPIAGLIGAFGTLAAVTRMAAEHLNELGSAARLGGGGAGDVGAATRFGFRGPDAANAFRARLQDPMAQMFASRLGVPITPPEPFGTTNNTALLRTAAEGLSKITSGEERLRTARVLGLTDALRYIDVSARLGRVLDEQARIEKTLADPVYTRSANELSVASEAVSSSWAHLATALGQPFIDTAAEAATRLASATDGLAKWAQTQFGDAGTSAGIKKSFFGGGPMGELERMLGIDTSKSIWDHLGLTGGGASGAAGSETADNTNALRDLNHTFKTALTGQTGGGPRARSIIPPAWTGQVLDRGLEAGAIRRGATTLRA